MPSKPLTAHEIADGRMHSFAITVAVDPRGKPLVTHIAAASAARALRVLADRMEQPGWGDRIYQAEMP